MLIIDAFAFCRHNEQRSGKLKLVELPRLNAECVSGDGDVEWSLVGSISERIDGYCALHLTVTATVKLLCQRCLTPYPFQIQSSTSMLLVKDEQTADQVEAFLQDDEIEVIVGSKTFDVIALIEDEALLAIPISPKHEVCPTGAKKSIDDSVKSKDGKKESPFAVLKNQLPSKK